MSNGFKMNRAAPLENKSFVSVASWYAVITTGTDFKSNKNTSIFTCSIIWRASRPRLAKYVKTFFFKDLL